MGRRIILLDMETADAEAFVRSIAADNPVYFVDSEISADPLPLPAKVQAVVAKPTLACKCVQVAESKYQRRRRLKADSPKMEAFSRSAKFGWWCCSTCRRPSRAAVSHWITSMLVGANDLLPVILGTGPATTPQDRWVAEGGVPNPHVNADHHTPGVVKALDGEIKTRRRKAKATQSTGI